MGSELPSRGSRFRTDRRPSWWRHEVECTTDGRSPRLRSASTTTCPGSAPGGQATCQEAESRGRRISKSDVIRERAIACRRDDDDLRCANELQRDLGSPVDRELRELGVVAPVRDGEDRQISLEQRLSDRIIVERAKGILVQRLKITEGDAYKRLRLLSRRQRRQIWPK